MEVVRGFAKASIAILALCYFVGALAPEISLAVPGVSEPANPTTNSADSNTDTVESLLLEAEELFTLDRPIDGRAKLQKALKLAPEDYRPHLMLSRYYLGEVGHFRLAYRYVRNAERLFEKQYGSDKDGTLVRDVWRQHELLLYILAESRLNLDQYQKTLDSLDRYAKLYWRPWYPGTRAWVLMKLKRVDEAIRVAQAGLLRDAEPGRTYNILGILLSLKGSRKLSLRAFARAIQEERKLGFRGQVATPLNNAGEVYRELFEDAKAEASWLKATQLIDGCSHILPSLNLAMLYIDQLRLFQAERVLNDFEACFAEHSEREDSEHRTLLALARGRIKLHQSQADRSIEFLSAALEREQSFGKIGTNENDVRFAASIAMAQALNAKAAELSDRVYDSSFDQFEAKFRKSWLRLRAWWLNRRAREIALNELSDLEDLYIRNTDTMLEYPTLGTALAGFSTTSFEKRIKRMFAQDSRKTAQAYYRVFFGTNLLANGDEDEAVEQLNRALVELREVDRLARAEATAKLIKAEKAKRFFLSFPSKEDRIEELKQKQELFSLLPSHLRYHDLALPIVFSYGAANENAKQMLKELSGRFPESRFQEISDELRPHVRYGISLVLTKRGADSHSLSITLTDRKQDGRQLASAESSEIDSDGQTALLNKFIASVFRHRVDPPGIPLPQQTLIDGVL